jgi:hypothetical protein
MLSKAYADYLAYQSVIEPVYLDAAGRVIATAKAKPSRQHHHHR